MLKTRWRSIFLRALEIRPILAPKVVGACCILHDIWDPEVEEEEYGGDHDRGEDPKYDADICFRARLAAQVSAPADLPACLNEHDYI